MIDLRFSNLPQCVEVDGHLYRLNTSFRTWIEFGARLEAGETWLGVFADEIPAGDWVPAVMEFFRSETVCPHDTQRADSNVLDLLLDGELIVAAFQQAYGIDLTQGDMHWHRFKALLASIPEDTKLSKVMGYRTYRTPSKSDTTDAAMKRLRRVWSLPEPETEVEKEELLRWAETALPW